MGVSYIFKGHVRKQVIVISVMFRRGVLNICMLLSGEQDKHVRIAIEIRS